MTDADGDAQRRREQGLISREAAQSVIDRAKPLMDENRFDEALAVFDAAIRDQPNDIESMRNLGILLSRLGRLAEGETMLRAAREGAGGIAYYDLALGLNLMMQGRYAEGWPLYTARERISSLNTGIPTGLPMPRWDGVAEISGRRLLIVPEQGFGDQMQFVRFVPELVRRGVAVTLLAMPALERLFRHNLAGVDILVASGALKVPPVDLWAPLMDVFGAWAATGAPLPQPPYLSPPGRWNGAPAGFKIGIATTGNTALINDQRRSLTDAQAARLRAMLPGEVFDLDPAVSRVRDFADTAAVVQALDLVVTVDTAVAHLAGAMGKTCFLILPGYGTDWRWMRERDDTPWYPSLRLYRNGMDGDWEDVFAAVARDAAALAGRGAAAPV